MKIQTHLSIDQRLCGTPAVVSEGYAKVKMSTVDEMAADDSGLIHGGFVFGMADYAAMLAVNHPNVVLGAAEVTFLKPVALGHMLVAEARVERTKGQKKVVNVSVLSGEQAVFKGVFTCFVLEQHVLGQV